MESGATFLYKEIITLGWSDTDQPFRFNELRLKLKVYEENRLILFDHYYQKPDQGINQSLMMEGYTHDGSFLIVTSNLQNEFLEKLSRQLQQCQYDCRIGLSRFIPSAVIIRVLGNHTDHIEHLFSECHPLTRQHLLKEPYIFLRKY